MANHTYVVVGVTEISSSNTFTPTEPLTGMTNGLGSNASGNTGCVIVEIMATEDGTNSTTSTNSGANLLAVCQPYILKNVHLVELNTFTNGNMSRPTCTGSADLLMYGQTNPCATPQQWPLGTFNNGVFVGFDPQGSAHSIQALPSGGITDNPISPFVELGIQETHGSTVTSTLTNLNYGALQIEGISGVNHFYTP